MAGLHPPTVAGLVAAEGCFTSTSPGNRRRFAFRMSLAATDEGLCEQMLDQLGVGRITRSPRRRAHYDDEVTYQVQSVRELVKVVVPFMDAWLPPSHKRDQYLAWRSELLEHWEHRAKRPRPCSIEGCDEPRRALGLCRRHYHQATGR